MLLVTDLLVHCYMQFDSTFKCWVYNSNELPQNLSLTTHAVFLNSSTKFKQSHSTKLQCTCSSMLRARSTLTTTWMHIDFLI